MSKHTPGPWTIDHANSQDNADVGIHGPDIDGLSSLIICDLCLDGYDQKMQVANAKLIAAAPELLEALLEVLPLVKHTDDAGWEKMKRARLACEKATT